MRGVVGCIADVRGEKREGPRSTRHCFSCQTCWFCLERSSTSQRVAATLLMPVYRRKTTLRDLVSQLKRSLALLLNTPLEATSFPPTLSRDGEVGSNADATTALRALCTPGQAESKPPLKQIASGDLAAADARSLTALGDILLGLKENRQNRGPTVVPESAVPI